jgi:hypothetical protein
MGFEKVRLAAELRVTGILRLAERMPTACNSSGTPIFFTHDLTDSLMVKKGRRSVGSNEYCHATSNDEGLRMINLESVTADHFYGKGAKGRSPVKRPQGFFKVFGIHTDHSEALFLGDITSFDLKLRHQQQIEHTVVLVALEDDDSSTCRGQCNEVRMDNFKGSPIHHADGKRTKRLLM